MGCTWVSGKASALFSEDCWFDSYISCNREEYVILFYFFKFLTAKATLSSQNETTSRGSIFVFLVLPDANFYIPQCSFFVSEYYKRQWN